MQPRTGKEVGCKMTRQVEQWKIFEERFSGPAEGNPFREVRLSADFSDGVQKIAVTGFYDGGGVYVIRFMPRTVGLRTYTTHSNVKKLDGLTGTFECVPASEGNHGPVRLRTEVVPAGRRTEEDRFRFSYEDGTPYHPFGTTCYAWVHQPEELQEETLRTLAQSPFNKIRMCIFPKYYTYNTADPEWYAFDGNREAGFDFSRFNTKFFAHLEKRIGQLDGLGIEADLILFHPYDRWGFSRMTKRQDDFYLSYVAARLSPFKNIWWSLANEYDLMAEKSIDDWERFARIIEEHDPVRHLRSIHNCHTFYDFTRSWVTHCSIQRVDVTKTAESVTEWRGRYQKPVVIDECAYEGNINYGWGNITGEEMTRRFWEGVIRGGYLSHGETYVDPNDILWWSHGGRLHGESPERIAFLKKIVGEAPGWLTPREVTDENLADNWDVPCAHIDETYYLYYFSFMRPAFRTFRLPEGHVYRIEIIDTWNRTVTLLAGTFSGDIRIDLPARQYIAVRMTEV